MTVHTTDTPKPEQPNPLLDQFPNILAIRNRLADMKQDISAVTSALTALHGRLHGQPNGIQTAENTQACVRATEFLWWLDMAIQKYEIEEAAKLQYEAIAAMTQAGDVPQEPSIIPPLTPNGEPPEPTVPLTE